VLGGYYSSSWVVSKYGIGAIEGNNNNRYGGDYGRGGFSAVVVWCCDCITFHCLGVTCRGVPYYYYYYDNIIIITVDLADHIQCFSSCYRFVRNWS